MAYTPSKLINLNQIYRGKEVEVLMGDKTLEGSVKNQVNVLKEEIDTHLNNSATNQDIENLFEN